MSALDQSEAQPRAMRLIFTYDGDKVSLDRTQEITKRVPPSDPLLRDGETASRSGFWIEITDDRRRPLWRRVMDDPRTGPAEAPVGQRGGGLTRARVTSPRGSFRVLVPALAKDRDVSVVASPLGAGPIPGPARLLGRFDLRSGKRVDTPAREPTDPQGGKPASTKRPDEPDPEGEV